ncbi:MAG: PAS domain S-box protein [Candidatus Abyssobacteria bacterium SURF_5]|uniref:PAS domain S-box protein n=1 Tax=Abyssobacteria bacterium (strain SURF_5) TaxID=2093360 RepID=A0A3A4NQC5_ABYX5|nr:MAG: PAS domain S-box protein [Candidatus Abyssubacteria bacterium SURF_5]
MWHLSPALLLLLILSGIGTFMLALYFSQKREAPEATTLFILMTAAAVWCFAYMLELGSVELSGKLFWAKMKYFGIVAVSPTWLILCLQYTNRETWIKPRYIGLLCIVPLFNLILVWTNHLHTLYWTGAALEKTGAFSVIELVVGPGFWFCTAHNYLLMLCGAILILGAFLRSNPLYRKQATTMLLAALFPWAGNVLFVAGWTPLEHLDLTPFAFVVSGMLCGWAILHQGLLDLIPVAHASIVSGITDSIIVLDRQNRLVETNPSAQRLVSLSAADMLGRPLQEILPELSRQFDPSLVKIIAVEDIEFGTGADRRIYELRLSPLADRKGVQIGKVLVLRDVTKNRLAEENAKQQNEFLRNVVESITHPFYVLDAETFAIKLANSAAIAGGMPGESTCYALTHRKDRPCDSTGHPCPLKKVKQTKKPVSIEHIHDEGDGPPKHFQVYGYPILDNEGTVVQMIEYHLDITARRRMEEALRESEARLRAVIESLPFDFFMLDNDGRYVMQNSTCKKQWGNVLGKRPEELDVSEESLLLWRSNYDGAYSGETVQGDVFLGAKRGFCHNIAAPIVDQGKVNGILGINIDITERKRMEEELVRHRERLQDLVAERTEELATTNAKLIEEIAERRKKEQALQESEELYRNLFENSIQGIFIMDLNGRFVSCNPALEKVLGYTSKEILGKSFHEHVAPGAEKMLLREYGKLFRSGVPIRNLRYEIIGKGGERRTVETNVSLIRKGNRSIGFQGTATDITDQVQAQDALMKSEERYRLLVDNSLTAIYVLQDEKVQFVNSRSEEIIGYNPSELLGKPFYEFLHPADRQVAREFVATSLSGESRGGRFQARVLHKNESVRWLEALASTIRIRRKIRAAGQYHRRHRAERSERSPSRKRRKVPTHSRNHPERLLDQQSGNQENALR